MDKTHSKPSISVIHKKHKDCSLGEEEIPAHLKEKAVKTKRPADGSPENVSPRKRAAFGDITNASFNKQPERGGEKNSIVRKEKEWRQCFTKTSTKVKQNRCEEKDSPIKDQKPTKGECLDSTGSLSVSDSASTSLEEPLSCNLGSDDNKNKSEEEQHSNKNDGKLAADAVINIDADTSDPVTVSDYANEIFVNMKKREECFPLTNYLQRQPEISAQMRATLVNWLVEVQEQLKLYHETLYLGVKLLDHFLERNTIKQDELRLVGATSLFISSKLEERDPPCMDDFIFICDDAYKQQQFIAMEIKILSSLGFDINISIPYRFLRRYAKAAFVSGKTLTLAYYLLECSLLEDQFIPRRASLMASSCLNLAMMMKNCGEWTVTLVHYTGYSKEQLRDCVLQLNAMNSAPADKNLMAVRNKYSHKDFHEVSTILPLDPDYNH